MSSERSYFLTLISVLHLLNSQCPHINTDAVGLCRTMRLKREVRGNFTFIRVCDFPSLLVKTQLKKASHLFHGHWLVTFSRPLSKAGEGRTSKWCAWVYINWMSYLLLQSQIASFEVIMVRLCSSAAGRFTESSHYPPSHFPPHALKTVFPQSGLERTLLSAVWKDMGKHLVMANRNTWGSTRTMRSHYHGAPLQPGSSHPISAKAGTQSWGPIYCLVLQWRHA